MKAKKPEVPDPLTANQKAMVRHYISAHVLGTLLRNTAWPRDSRKELKSIREAYAADAVAFADALMAELERRAR